MGDDITVKRSVTGDIDAALVAAKEAAEEHSIDKVSKVEVVSKKNSAAGFTSNISDESWTVTVTGSDD